MTTTSMTSLHLVYRLSALRNKNPPLTRDDSVRSLGVKLHLRDGRTDSPSARTSVS